MEPRVQRAEPRDCGSIGDLATALVGFEADRRVCFEAALASRGHDVLVAEADDVVVGYAHLMVYPDLTHGARAGELLALVVREDMRRQGVASALMREIMHLARRRGVSELHISTEVDNHPAKALYRSLGAEVVGVQMEIELEAEDEE